MFGAGSTTADVIVDALEDAFEDGMDIVNRSLGAAFVWGQEYPTTAASKELSAQGVAVVNSAGNSGGAGVYSLSAPANAHDIISVASADNTFLDAFVFEVDQLDDPVPYLEMCGAELPPTEGESESVALPSGDILGCSAGDFADFPAGHVALIQRGICPFADKYVNAADAGATGVVIHSNVPGLFAGTILDAGIEGVWSAGISDTDGEALVDLIEDGETVTLEFTDEELTVANPTGGLMSSFSSCGQDVEPSSVPASSRRAGSSRRRSRSTAGGTRRCPAPLDARGVGRPAPRRERWRCPQVNARLTHPRAILGARSFHGGGCHGLPRQAS